MWWWGFFWGCLAGGAVIGIVGYLIIHWLLLGLSPFVGAVAAIFKR